jgi:hypothetical protein
MGVWARRQGAKTLQHGDRDTATLRTRVQREPHWQRMRDEPDFALDPRVPNQGI